MSKNSLTNFFRIDKSKIILTIIFIIFLALGFFGFPPFGKPLHASSDVHPILIAPLYLMQGIMPFLSPLIPLLVILIYYYLIACMLVFIYQQFKEKKKR